jgi:branched-chain amino acid transport system permease protein
VQTIRTIIKDTLITGIIAFLVFGPITGVLLKGFEIELAMMRPLLLTLVVMAGRLLFLITPYRKSTHVRAHTLVKPPSKHHHWLLLLAIVIGLGASVFMGKYWLTVSISILIYILLGLGLNIVVGLAGLLDLGFVAFYAVGAYTYALGSLYWDIGFWTAIPLGMLIAATLGAVLAFPVLRMHGDYLAIVTLGFGEIVNRILNNWMSFTKGPNGVSFSDPMLFGLEFTRKAHQGGTPFHEYFNLPYTKEYFYLFIYCVLFLAVCLIVKLVSRLKALPIGRAWEALREDEIACRSLGINHVTTKLTAFSMGAMIGGLGGVFFAAYQGFVNPISFTFIESAMILAIVVLGGMGSVLGVITAAVLLTLLPEVLREFSEYRMLVFGIMMVLMMVWRPRGLIRNVRLSLDRIKAKHG